MCSIISLFFPEAAGKTLRELNYTLTEKGSKAARKESRFSLLLGS